MPTDALSTILWHDARCTSGRDCRDDPATYPKPPDWFVAVVTERLAAHDAEKDATIEALRAEAASIVDVFGNAPTWHQQAETYERMWSEEVAARKAAEAEVDGLRRGLSLAKRERDEAREAIRGSMALRAKVAAVEALAETLNLHCFIPRAWGHMLNEDQWADICDDGDACLIWDLSRAATAAIRAALADPEVPRD